MCFGVKMINLKDIAISFNSRLTISNYKNLKKRAKQMKLSMNNLLNKILQEYFKNE